MSSTMSTVYVQVTSITSIFPLYTCSKRSAPCGGCPLKGPIEWVKTTFPRWFTSSSLMADCDRVKSKKPHEEQEHIKKLLCKQVAVRILRNLLNTKLDSLDDGLWVWLALAHGFWFLNTKELTILSAIIPLRAPTKSGWKMPPVGHLSISWHLSDVIPPPPPVTKQVLPATGRRMFWIPLNMSMISDLQLCVTKTS